MTADPGKLLLLDTPSLYFRAFFGVPDTMTAPDGTPINAVRGLLDFIARLISDRQPTRLIAAMDNDWRPAFRVEALPSYKAHRVAHRPTRRRSPTRCPRRSPSSRTCSRRWASRASASTATRPTT